MNLFGFEFDEVKCGSCNWETTQLFVIADTEEGARELLRSGNAGLCGSCMCELLVDEEYEIELSEKRREEWKRLVEKVNRNGRKERRVFSTLCSRKE
jgi:hypothetical protein